MFRLTGCRQSRWGPCLVKALPVVPLAFGSENPVRIHQPVPENEDGVLTAPGDSVVTDAAGDHDPGADTGGDGAAHVSPLTYGKVFGAIPRMSKAINTPVINIRIAQAFGLPSLSSSSGFKKIYSSGREVLR